MAYSPGELLLRGGALDAGQLRRALDRREQEGGSLGENVVALGFLSEEELANLYHKRLVLPRIAESQLENIDRDVLALVPPELAAEMRVVPVHMDPVEGLTVAMSDPSDIHAIEEVAFFVDKFILRCVATESAVRRAIHRYYGLLSPPKNADFALAIDASGDDEPTPAPVLLTKKKAPPPLPPTSVPTPTPAPATKAAPPAAKAAPPIAEPSPPIATASSSVPMPSPFVPPEEPVLLTKKRSEHSVTLPGVSPGPVLPPIEALRDAVARDRVASLLLDFTAQVVGRAALFVSKKGELVGTDVRGEGLDRGRIEMLQVPLSRPSLFEAVVKSRLPYRGAMPDSPLDKTLARALGTPSGDVLVWPILVRDRVVAVLYADTLKRDLPEAAIQATLYETGRAYERLLMQKAAR